MLRILGFKTEYKGERAVDWVHYTSRDALSETGQVSHSTWARIRDVKPPESGLAHDHDGLKAQAIAAQWAAIEPAYAAWKAGQELPEVGTPLGAWPGVTPEQATALRGVGLTTVEGLANAPESIRSKPPIPGLRNLCQQAAQWLEGRDKAAVEDELAQLREERAAMLEMMAEMKAALDAKADKPKGKQPEAA